MAISIVLGCFSRGFLLDSLVVPRLSAFSDRVPVLQSCLLSLYVGTPVSAVIICRWAALAVDASLRPLATQRSRHPYQGRGGRGVLCGIEIVVYYWQVAVRIDGPARSDAGLAQRGL